MASPPSTVSVCPSLALAGQVVWTQSYGPSCSSCVLSSRGVSGAAFCCFGLLLHPLLQWSSLDSSYSLVVQLLVFSWTLCWSSFLSLPVFADSLGWLSDIPWLSALSCLTAGGVALVFCQGQKTSGAAVPLGSSVLRGSWSSRRGPLSQVEPVVFLGPRS